MSSIKYQSGNHSYKKAKICIFFFLSFFYIQQSHFYLYNLSSLSKLFPLNATTIATTPFTNFPRVVHLQRLFISVSTFWLSAKWSVLQGLRPLTKDTDYTVSGRIDRDKDTGNFLTHRNCLLATSQSRGLHVFVRVPHIPKDIL